MILNTYRFEQRRPTIARAFQRRGYATAAFVGGGYLDSFYGYDYGFDWYENRRATHFQRRLPSVYDFLEGAKSWLRSIDDQPFFLFLHTYQVHDYASFDDPRFVAPDLDGVYGHLDLVAAAQRHRSDDLDAADRPLVDYMRQRYDSAVHHLDRRLGDFFEFMLESGLNANTVVVITSDHGEEFGEHGRTAHGWTLYEEMLRVPLIWWLPPGMGMRGRVEGPASSVDILPTVVDLFGLAPIPSDGVSLLPRLQDLSKAGSAERAAPADPRIVYAEVDEGATMFAAVSAETKLIYGPEYGGSIRPNPIQWERFQLKEDPTESRNLCPGSADGCGAQELEEALVAIAERSRSVRESGQEERLPLKLRELLQSLGYATD
jgi:arylsulfatase A-like enzyme